MIILQYGFGRCAPGQIQAMFYMMRLSDDDFGYCIQMLLFNLVLYRVVAMCLLYARVNRWGARACTESCHQKGAKIENYFHNLRLDKGIPGPKFQIKINQ